MLDIQEPGGGFLIGTIEALLLVGSLGLVAWAIVSIARIKRTNAAAQHELAGIKDRLAKVERDRLGETPSDS